MSSEPSIRDLLLKTQESVLAFESFEDDFSYNEALASIQTLQRRVERPGDFAAKIRFQARLAPRTCCPPTLILREVDFPEHRLGDARASWRFPEHLRLMRTLTAVDIFEEVDVHTYRSTPRAEVLADPGQIAGMRWMLELHGKTGADVCRYLDDIRKPPVDNGTPSALQFAFGGKSMWELFDDDPSLHQLFTDYMKTARRGGHVQLWHLRYPPCRDLKSEALKTDDNAILMVDVGGGAGGQVAAFRTQFPDLPGKCILQDLPQTLGRNPAIQGVSFMAYDFFTPQPVKRARIYLFRSVCHDFTDTDCRKLLRNTVAAMDPEYSRLLIDEWVLSESGVDLKAANMDLNMMLLFNAMERTETQWTQLLDDVGLEIVEVYRIAGAAESVIETKVKRIVA